MVEIFSFIQKSIAILRENLLTQFDPHIILIFLIFYSIFLAWTSLSYIHKFSIILSKKRIIELNLDQYNVDDNPLAGKFWGFCSFFFKSIILEPVIILIWFYFYAGFIFFIPFIPNVKFVLAITLSLVLSVRFLAFVNEDYALKYARVTGFIVAVISLISLFMPQFVTILTNRFFELYSLLGLAFFYLLIILIFELVFRITFYILNVD